MNLTRKSFIWLWGVLLIASANWNCSRSKQSPVEAPKDQASFTCNGATLVSKGAFAELTDEFFGGNTLAIKIFFSADVLTDADRPDLLNNDGKKLRTKDHAILVLFLDKGNRLLQANLTVVTPGQTLVRTVASTSEELKQFSQRYIFDGMHLKFQNKGAYAEPNDATLNLTWDIDVDLPVAEKISKNSHR